MPTPAEVRSCARDICKVIDEEGGMVYLEWVESRISGLLREDTEPLNQCGPHDLLSYTE